VRRLRLGEEKKIEEETTGQKYKVYKVCTIPQGDHKNTYNTITQNHQKN